MTDKEKIRAEVERRLKRENAILWNAKLRGTYAPPSCKYNLLTLTSIRDFIDSLPEENGRTLFEEIAYPGSFGEFVAGLNPPPKIPEMKKDEELKEAVDAEIVKDIHNFLHVKSEALPISTKHRFGDKVRIIIIK